MSSTSRNLSHDFFLEVLPLMKESLKTPAITLDLSQHIDLPEKALTKLYEACQVSSFKRGEKIICEGMICRNLFFIAKGVARAYKKEEKVDNVFAFFQEGDYLICPASFMYGESCRMNVEALEDVKVYKLSWEDFKDIEKNHPQLNISIYQILTQKLILQLQEKNRLLNLTATERYMYFLENYPDLVHRVSLGQISVFLGMRQSSLSRVRRDIHLQYASKSSY